MFQFRNSSPFAKQKKKCRKVRIKRMALDDQEDGRLKAQKKFASTFQEMAKQETETDPGIKEAEEKNTKLKYRVVSIELW